MPWMKCKNKYINLEIVRSIEIDEDGKEIVFRFMHEDQIESVYDFKSDAEWMKALEEIEERMRAINRQEGL